MRSCSCGTTIEGGQGVHGRYSDRMERASLTTIGRPVDLRVPSNRAIAVLAVLAAVGGAVHAAVLGHGPGSSLLRGAVFGGAAFLGWAMGREVDPDHPLSAFLAAGLALLGAVVVGQPDFLLLFWALVSLRVINRSPGLPAGIVDSAGLVALGVGVALRWGWPVLGLTALALALDGLLEPAHRRHLPLAALTLGTAGVLAVARPGEVAWAIPEGWVLSAVLACTVALVVVTLRTGQLHSVGDQGVEFLRLARVRAAQLVAGLTGLVFAFAGDAAGFSAAAPLWAAIVGLALYRWGCYLGSVHDAHGR